MIQIEDFRGNIRTFPSSMPKQRFVLGHLSLPPEDMGRILTGRRVSHSTLGDDKAASEWETVAPTQEQNGYEGIDCKMLRRKRSLELVFHAHDNLNAAPVCGYPVPRRNTILGPPDISLPKLPSVASCEHITTYPSFYSSSSFYSDIDGDEEITEEHLQDPEACAPGRSSSRRRPATMGLGRNLRGDLLIGRRASKTSSSTSGDPFKYDGVYPTFLQPETEFEVSSALHRAGISHSSTLDMIGPPKVEHIGLDDINPSTRSSFYSPAAIRST